MDLSLSTTSSFCSHKLDLSHTRLFALHLICRVVCALSMPCFFKPDMHHTRLCILPCLCGGCLLCCLLSFRCCFFGLVPITSRLWGFVHLHPFVFLMDSFFFLAWSQARWPYPRNHFYLCLLVARSFAMPRYLPLAITCLPYCHDKPLTHLPSKPLLVYVTAFAQPLL